MHLKILNNQIIVYRDKKDAKIYSDSLLLHKVKLLMNNQGYDLIKKLMCKDGHLVNDGDHYLRTRKADKKQPSKNIYIYNSRSNIEAAYYDYNNDGATVLSMEKNVFRINK